MPVQTLERLAVDHRINGAFDVQEFVRGEFYDDTYGLISTPPPLGIAAALAGTTVAVTALAVFVVSEIAGRYSARSRGAQR